jgi:hypothetical protein
VRAQQQWETRRLLPWLAGFNIRQRERKRERERERERETWKRERNVTFWSVTIGCVVVLCLCLEGGWGGDEGVWSVGADMPLNEHPCLYPVPYLLLSGLSASVMEESSKVGSSTCVVRRVV